VCKQTDKIQTLVAGNYSAPETSPEDLFVREKPSSDIQNPNLFFLITKPRKPQKHRNPIRLRKPAQMGTKQKERKTQMPQPNLEVEELLTIRLSRRPNSPYTQVVAILGVVHHWAPKKPR
jgi:hypothetical protein